MFRGSRVILGGGCLREDELSTGVAGGRWLMTVCGPNGFALQIYEETFATKVVCDEEMKIRGGAVQRVARCFDDLTSMFVSYDLLVIFFFVEFKFRS